jgi:hypothetical protein
MVSLEVLAALRDPQSSVCAPRANKSVSRHNETGRSDCSNSTSVRYTERNSSSRSGDMNLCDHFDEAILILDKREEGGRPRLTT